MTDDNPPTNGRRCLNCDSDETEMYWNRRGLFPLCREFWENQFMGRAIARTPFRHHLAVVVLIGEDCAYHQETLSAKGIRSMHGRYGRVMDTDQAEAWLGPTPDPTHRVAVRFEVPVRMAGGACVWGGWFAPLEVRERYDPEEAAWLAAAL